MSYPITIKYRQIENGDAFNDANFTYVYLTDILNFIFTDDYNRRTLKSEGFLFSLIDQNEVWSKKEDLENFISEFKDLIHSTNKFDKQLVSNKETHEKIEWFVTDITPFIKCKSLFSFSKSNSEYKTLRFFNDLTFCINNGTTNLEFTFDDLNLNDIFEAAPIAGTTDYQKGDKIKIIKKSISGIKEFESGLKELDNLKNFVLTNKLEFSFYDANI